jgi:putative ABC transport system permease protein
MMASKNFKRNRKRYRSTVISLFLSVTLFISASSFCSYLTDIVKDETSYISDVDISYYTVGDDKPDPNMTLDMLSAVNGVERSAYVEKNYQTMFFDSDVLTPELIEKVGSFDIGDGDTSSINLRFAFLDDTSFNMLCEENNIDPSEFFDTASPKGIMYNRLNGMDENGKLFSVKFADEAALPTVFRAINNIDGYVNLGLEKDGDGRQCVVYYSEQYME